MSGAVSATLLLLPTAAFQAANAGGAQASGGFSVAAETSQQVSFHGSVGMKDDQTGDVSASRAKASKWDWEALTDFGNVHALIDAEQKKTPISQIRLAQKCL